MLAQPALLEGRLVLGMALIAMGRHDEVLQEMRVALESDPHSAVAWLMKGEALVGKRDLAQAELAVEKARYLDPSNPKAAQLLAVIDRARRAGVEDVPVEATGTKEYPARSAANVKWRAVSSYHSAAYEAPEPDEGTAVDKIPEEPLPETMLAPALPKKPELPQAGPEEQTMLAGPVGIAGGSRGDRETRELGALGAAVDALDGFALPVVSETKPGRREQRTMPEDQPSIVLDEHGFVDTGEVTNEPPAVVVNERVTREVQQLDRLDARPYEESSVRHEPLASVMTQQPLADPSIAISVDDVVFAPGEDPSIVHVAPDRGEPSDPSVEEYDGSIMAALADEPSEVGTTIPRAKPIVVPEPPVVRPSAQPVHFVAPLPLGGVVSVDAPRDVHPRINARPRPSSQERTPVRAEPRPRSEPQRRVRRQRPAPGLWSRVADALQLEPASGHRDWVTFGAVVVGLFATAVIAGLLIREWRLRARVARRYELAAAKLTTGNYSGYQAAELLYGQILAERDDRKAAALRAKVLAQLSFEFGEPPDPAQRAIQRLPSTNQPEEREARIYLALAKGELEVAQQQAAALVKDRPGPQARYLLGQADLLLDQPEDAATALRTAATEDASNPIVLHALGLAEAALKRDDRAFKAYGDALTANANHVATIIDRALLYVRQGIDRDAAAGSLEGVVGKLVGDASPGQLARAYVGLAEIELAKGNVAAARTALSSAAARRRDHPLLLEELAKAYADAFELDPAEREARRALSVSGRLTPRLILAEVALRRSRPVQALTILEESGSSRPEALVLRALAKLELGRTAEARADAELATRLDPSSVAAAVALARVDIGEGKYDVARQRLEVLEKQGQYAEVAWALGQVYMARRMPDRARFCFRTALHRQPLLLQARLALAQLEHDAGQLAEARDEVNRILATNAAYVPARRELASIALDLGDAVAARDEYDALAERDPELDTLLGGARARLLLADARGALDHVERALKLKPTGTDLETAQCIKARALLADHRSSDAIVLLRSVVPTETRGEPAALFMEAYLDYGRPEWAERSIDLAPIATRNGIELTLARARLAIEQARQSAGKALAEEALQRLKTGRAPIWLRVEAYALLGQAESELGLARDAVRTLKAALDLDPRDTRALYSMGLADLDLRRPEDAATAFEGVVSVDPRFANAQYYLGRTRRSLNDARGDEALRAFLELSPKGPLADDARQLLGEPATPTSDPLRSRRPEP